MPATTARDLITDVLVTLGIVTPGATVNAALMDTGFRRLNAFVGGLALQSLTTPAMVREVFPLTSNVGVYTIGPGGDFDTTQPAALTGAAVLLNNNLSTAAVTSITSSGSVATVTTTANHGAATGQNVTIHGATQDAYNGTWPIVVTGVNTFTYLFGSATSPATGTITAFFESNLSTVVEMPIPVVTNDSRQWNQVKSMPSPLVTSVYYNQTGFGGFATITVWPIPTVTTNALVLYSRQQLARFATLTTQYFLPEGSEEAIHYGLARRLITPLGVTDQAVVEDVRDLARTTMGAFKRSNFRLADIPTDPALMFDRGYGYNILTDN